MSEVKYRVIERRHLKDIPEAMEPYDVEVLGPLTRIGPNWYQVFVGKTKEDYEPPKPKPKPKAKAKAKPKKEPKVIQESDGAVIPGFIPDDMK